MSKKLTTEEFVRRARKIHGNKYDYSKVNYQDQYKKVCIICPIHGEFLKAPSAHIRQKQGCPTCTREGNKKLILGVGINDFSLPIRASKTKIKSYIVWLSMLDRCYNEKTHIKYPTYKDCTVCEEWKRFSSFKEWFDEHYREGWHLDKDILVKGNKIYSPETCCFVPFAINKLFTKSKASRGEYPIGVSYHRKKYDACLNTKNGAKNRRTIGSFNTPEEAFQAYKNAKEKWIKEIADRWKDQLEPRVYKAMYEYQVEITD